MGIEANIPHEIAAQRLKSGLAAFVGRGRPLSAAVVADAAGWSLSAVEKAAAGDYTPGLAALLRLKAVLPVSFTNHMLELAGIGGARRLDGVAKAAGVVMAELATETAVFAKALADGRIDHVERAELCRTLPALIESLTNLQVELSRGQA